MLKETLCYVFVKKFCPFRVEVNLVRESISVSIWSLGYPSSDGLSLKSLLVIPVVMYILRPYESKALGRQLLQSPGNGLFSWNLL